MPELLDVARRIAAMARPGEQVEAYVTRGSSTTVRAYAMNYHSRTPLLSSLAAKASCPPAWALTGVPQVTLLVPAT